MNKHIIFIIGIGIALFAFTYFLLVFITNNDHNSIDRFFMVWVWFILYVICIAAYFVNLE